MTPQAEVDSLRRDVDRSSQHVEDDREPEEGVGPTPPRRISVGAPRFCSGFGGHMLPQRGSDV